MKQPTPLFSTRSAHHLAQNIPLPQGACTIKQFSDGELFVRIEEDVRDKQVWVLAATVPPAENLLELFFLLNALERAGAQTKILITYFSYARQVIAAPSEARTAQVVGDFFKNFTLKQIAIVHPHTLKLQEFLTFTPIFDIPFFCEQAQQYDAIAAPDKGAAELARKVALACKKELILLTKMRPEQEHVEILTVDGIAANKKVLLIDDMVSTGRTLVAAAEKLKSMGATSIAAAAMHGVFSPGSHEFLEQSLIEKIYVTNTIAQSSRGKVTVVDISTMLAKFMGE